MKAAAPSTAVASTVCPVCRDPEPERFLTVGRRDYWRCARCQARFLDRAHLPSREDEHAHYLHHENDPADPGYRRFLAKLANPLLLHLRRGSSGLDFGCGPGPALATMLQEADHRMAVYDPLFFPDAAPLEDTYDFVTCTETAEHFHHPAASFRQLMELVRPGGWLAVMTCFQSDDARFENWHYRMDPTHVVFYREATLRHVAASQGWTYHVPAKDVALMQKPEEWEVRK